MTIFSGINSKLSSWLNSSTVGLEIEGPNLDEWAFVFYNLVKENNCLKTMSHLFITQDQETSEKLYSTLKSNVSTHEVLFYPGLENSPYSGQLFSETSLNYRIGVLSKLLWSNRSFIIVCSAEAATLLTPSKDFFAKNHFSIQTSDIISPDELSKKLIALGYQRSITVEEPGTFGQKGEIFDIYPIQHGPVRISYFDDMVEEIWAIDLETNKTDRSISYEEILIAPSSFAVLNDEAGLNFKKAVAMPGPQLKNRFLARQEAIDKIREKSAFENFSLFSSVLTGSESTLIDFFDDNSFVTHFIETHAIQAQMDEWAETLRIDYETENSDIQSDSVLLPPENIYKSFNDWSERILKKINIEHVNLSVDFDEDLKDKLIMSFESMGVYLTKQLENIGKDVTKNKALLDHLKNKHQQYKKIYITYKSENSKKEVDYLLETQQLSESFFQKIIFTPYVLNEGMFYVNENCLVLSDSDFFSHKIDKIKKKSKNYDVFAEQISTLKDDDYIIHSQFGIGRYKGLQTLKFGSVESDFIVIDYKDKDKVYVPVYKMDLVQKYADSQASVQVASLATNRFQQAKNKARESAKKLAFSLIDLQARRNASQGVSFETDFHEIKEFELDFPYKETKDQLQAVEDVFSDMRSERPMDRLICGDVGFGKTEIAMRSAFVSVVNKKQVAVLVPTTVLALQHYESFKKRFKNFAVEIEFISRLKTAAQTKECLEKVKMGKVDILIGTHKLLTKSLEFKDLGLVIVDEEQRFGVSHKEKLKLLKSNVDFLTMTATPIPRTLQLSFLGIRDFSLIKTAPPKRQSIKSYVIKMDDSTLKMAIDKEISRGGQVFFVHNRVNDIESISSYINELCPEAKVIVAHGQLKEKDLETRMKKFYDGQYNVLLSTTIIESGIDIPNANTMIVYHAHKFGLSQLHQLRGRIGRSDKKSYAYFVVPKERKLTDIASKRLKALMTYADLGGGFSIASSDLEIRGAGDILGPEQSGHLSNVGLELYMQLLEDAILEIKGEQKALRTDLEVVSQDASFIPSHFINDSSERLKVYKRLTNSKSHEDIDDIRVELVDAFGALPIEVENLFTIIHMKLTLANTGLSKVKISGTQVHLFFDRPIVESNDQLRSNIIQFFMSRPKVYKINPDYSVICRFKDNQKLQDVAKFAKDIAPHIVPC